MTKMVFQLQLIKLAHTTIGASGRVGGIYIYSYIYIDIDIYTCISCSHVREVAYNGNVNAIKLPPTTL